MKQSDKPRVLVMMATYNGEKYVAEQIESILAQKEVVVTLCISDDGSTDGTISICKSFEDKYPNIFFKINEKNKGVSKNFMDMVYDAEIKDFDFFSFSDQDDYWMPEKLIAAIHRLSEYENEPALYYSDVINVDADLTNARTNIYSPYFALENEPYIPLIVNWVLGCTMVFNKNMAEIIQLHKLDGFLRFHDSWIHLIASACGKCVSDNKESYILRRISSENVLGEKDLTLNPGRLFRAFLSLFSCNHHITETLVDLKKGYKKLIKSERLKEINDLIYMRYSFKQRIRVAMNHNVAVPSKKETFILKCRVVFNLL